MTVLSRLLIAVLLLFGCGNLWAADFIVIANPSVPAAKLTPDELSAIYLLRTSNWEDGTRIVPVNRESGSNARALFAMHILGQTQATLDAHWNRMNFKGITPPLIQESDKAVLAFVQRVSGAIGYVSASTELKGVKVLAEF